jgi:hypothetical protein
MNRLIPHSSPLMNRVSFVGNSLFIPFFLISVGMRVDIKSFFSGNEALKVSATILIVAYTTKWLAAFITQKLFKYSNDERKIIFGLGSSHAAATIAIVLMGFNLNLFNENVLNGTIVMVLITCLVSSFVTEAAAKKIAIAESKRNIIDDNENIERILVPVANPANFEQLIDLALLIKDNTSNQPIYPLTVVKDDHQTQLNILSNNKLFDKAIAHAAAADTELEIVTRVDINVAGGILRAIKELVITDLIIGWNGKQSAIDYFFGTIMSQLLQNTNQTVLVSKIIQPISSLKRLVIIVPNNAELEVGYKRWMQLTKRMADQLGAKIVYYKVLSPQNIQIDGSDEIVNPAKLKSPIGGAVLNLKTENQFSDWNSLEDIQTKLRPNDLLVVVAAREQTISFMKGMEKLPRVLSASFDEHNFVMVYPAQMLNAE